MALSSESSALDQVACSRVFVLWFPAAPGTGLAVTRLSNGSDECQRCWEPPP